MAGQDAFNLTDVIQAGAAVVAVLAGFCYVAFQREADSAAAGRAAGHLARHSVDFVSDRLNALVDPDTPMEFALRGARASEMIEVFRELEISRLPAEMIEPVAVIRSTVFAINKRIDEILLDDEKRRADRRARLHSAGRTLVLARSELDALRRQFLPWNQSKFEAAKLSPRMIVFLTEAKEALKCGEMDLPPANLGSPVAELSQ